MSIQKQKAHEREIDFFIVAENIKLNKEEIFSSNFKPNFKILKKLKIQIKEKKDKSYPKNSYMINCDLQRVM